MNAAIHPLLAPFALTLALSFVVGLALREYYIAEEHSDYFGSVRTYAFIGMLGFGLSQLPQAAVAYLTGFVALTSFLTIYYWRKSAAGKPGMIGVLTALLTYLIGPLALVAPAWFVILFAVSVLFMLNAKERIRALSERITQREVVTLATFLTLAGVILPLLPRGVVAPFLPLTPYQIWLAVVVSAGVSYACYLLQTFIFPRKGLLLTGFLGGLYSSTVTTLVIARRSRLLQDDTRDVAGALVAATAAMYFRLIAVVAFFDAGVATRIISPFAALGTLAGFAAYRLARDAPQGARPTPAVTPLQRNPLELNAAAVFAVLLVLMAFATHLALELAPQAGLDTLAVAAGLYDIDPFVISLLQGDVPVAQHDIVAAIILATASNNLLKTIYTVIFGQRAAAARASIVLLALAAASCAYLWL